MLNVSRFCLLLWSAFYKLCKVIFSGHNQIFLNTMCSTGARCFGRVRAHSSAVAFFVPPPVEPIAHVNVSLIGMRRRTFILICRAYIHIHMFSVFYNGTIYRLGWNRALNLFMVMIVKIKYGDQWRKRFVWINSLFFATIHKNLSIKFQLKLKQPQTLELWQCSENHCILW